MTAMLMTGLPALTVAANDDKPLTDYVDCTIGTGEHGHVFLGANVPFGYVQLGPTTGFEGWDHCSGYHYDDHSVLGFAHLHLSGTGCSDLGDVALLPVRDVEQTEVAFTHDHEQVRPGYYCVMLDDPKVKVELTATCHTGFHRYSCNAPKLMLRIDLKQGVGNNKAVAANMRQTGPTTIVGHRLSTGWADLEQVYFAMEFSQPVTMVEYSGVVSVISADTKGQPLLVKVGLSAVSTANALLNMQSELPGWDFDRTTNAADALWQSELSKVRISTADERTLHIFYTALYHTMIAPSVFSDVNGNYRGADQEVHNSAQTQYTTLSLWDTYRTLHPLMTLIHQDKMKGICQTMVNIFNEQGKLPIWHLMGCETNCMPGNSSMPVLGDMIVKGLIDDSSLQEQAFQAMKASSMIDARSLANLKADGFLATEKNAQSIARALEYCIDDDAVWQVARLLGHDTDADYFYRRSRTYSKYFDTQTGFMRGIDMKGRWRSPFTPFEQLKDYVEGNAWQYTWLVPHDVHGLVKLFGSEQRFTAKLDSLFLAEGDLGADAPPDISGLIGQYAHGNEPSHHIIYMYNYVGMPWKAAPRLREVMTTLYDDKPEGLCGNEDVGQMSAWYVLSAVGLYQVAPCGGRFVIGSPIVDEATLAVGNGRTFKVIVHNNSDKNIYVQRARLNGQRLDNSYIDYPDIVKGGTLELWMGNRPSRFGTKAANRP